MLQLVAVKCVTFKVKVQLKVSYLLQQKHLLLKLIPFINCLTQMNYWYCSSYSVVVKLLVSILQLFLLMCAGLEHIVEDDLFSYQFMHQIDFNSFYHSSQYYHKASLLLKED